ncbi:hypothetical protein EA187_10855 [Lujinxingia sediminis]|uniref:POTRA domain-containing protein n=1 Tax=Lujinxingia sediminis TaxID=2480984 RepID=A0ABY0CTN8_9DELT|nr:BamA/TamA family outer membrane protein [Lujinxingia sediminis]RVU44046.1 hypothetical protein EA187_10855 [Lujinxingia sediminis]
MASVPSHRVALAGVVWLALCTGCATTSKSDYIVPGTTDLRISQVDLRGVEQVSESELRDGLATREDPGWRAAVPWLPLIGAERQYFNQFSWQRDRERIETFYQRRGYFGASIVSESIIENPQESTISVRVTIDEGEPTRIERIELEGLDASSELSRDALLKELPLNQGAIFTQDDYLTTRDALGRRLREAGYAYAAVSGRAFVDPESQKADVFFFIDAGPRSRFGEVHIFGLEDVEERYVREAITLEPGERYDPQRLNETQEDVYELGVFGLVTVLPAHEAREFTLEEADDRDRLEDLLEESNIPDDSDPQAGVDARPRPGVDAAIAPGDDGAANREDASQSSETSEDSPRERALGVSTLLESAQLEAERRSRLDPEVPVVVRLKEAKKYNLRVGAGLAVESARQDVRGLLNWSARNFLGGLRRLDHFNAAGYAWAPGLIPSADLVNRGAILSSELRFSQPQFIERRTNLRLIASVERDVREGFSVWNPALRVGLDRPIFRKLRLEASYNVAYYNYFNVEESLVDVSTTTLGLDFQTEFLLEYLEQSLILDMRNDVLDPTSGALVALTVQEAGGFAVGGEFDFIKPVLSAEGYVPFDLLGRSVLAMRTRLGSVYNIGRDTGVPIQNRLYSGGTDGMRSFGRQRLSLYTPSGEAVPVGGLTQFEWSVEPRVRLVPNLFSIGDVWGAIFVDAATILRGQLEFDTAANDQGTVSFSQLAPSLLYGLGTGVWWNTPVGPVRLDFAYTLSDTSQDPRFRRCADPSTQGTEACVFVPQDDDAIQELLVGYGFYLSIGHSF